MNSFHRGSVVCLSLEHCVLFWSSCFKKDNGEGKGRIREEQQILSVVSMTGILQHSVTSYL